MTDSQEWGSVMPMSNQLQLLVQEQIDDLRRLDPIEAIAEAQKLHDVLLHLQSDAAQVRREAVRDLRIGGWTLRSIAEATGLTYQRIYQLEQGQDRKEKG